MEDKRTAILKATLNLISEHGFHATPMSLIAQEAGVGAGTIYRYFDSKETMIDELFLQLKADFCRQMMVGVGEGDQTREVFRKVWLNIFSYCIHNPAEMVFMEHYHNSPFLTPEVETQMQQMLAPLVKVFKTAISRGEVKDIPFEMLTAFIYDVTVAHAKRHISGVMPMDDSRIETALQACWDAIKAG